MFGYAKCCAYKCNYTATHGKYLGVHNYLPNHRRRINYNTCLCDVHFDSNQHTDLVLLDNYMKHNPSGYPFIVRNNILLQNCIISHYMNCISYYQKWYLKLNKIMKYIKRNKILIFDKFMESDNTKYSKYVSWFYDNRYHIFELEHNQTYKEKYFTIRDKIVFNIKTTIPSLNNKKVGLKNIMVESEHEDKKNILWNNFIKKYGL